jgi:predicted  nucleic acid-binding Zn-ribbon protein
MSEESDLDSVVTVSADGISVEKRFERDEFAVPAVEFTVQSNREEPATVRLVDHVPEEFPMDSVGFHPDYENDNWTAFKDHRVEFEREFGPGEEVVTVYGVRLEESDRAVDFMGEPEIAGVSVGSDDVPPDPLASVTDENDASMDANSITDIVSEEGNQVVRDVIAGERDTLPGLGDDEPAEPATAGAGEPAEAGAPDSTEAEMAEVDPIEDLGATGDADNAADEPAVAADPLTEPAAESVGEPDSTGEPEPTVEPADVEIDSASADGPDGVGEVVTAEPDLPATGNVASTLAEEIREGSVSDADLAVLRQELDVALPESTNVRIRHLQSRVEDLAAYTEALEEFIDENGTASQVLENVETFGDEIGELDAAVDALESEIDDVRDSEDERQAIDDLEDGVQALREDHSETSERVAALESEVGSVSENLEATREELREVRADLEGVQELESEIASIREELGAVSDLEGRLDAIEDLRTDIAAVRTEFDELEELVGANTDDLTALDDTLSNVEAELAGVTDVEGDLHSVDERLEALSESVAATESTLESAVSDLQSEVESITDDVEEIRTWRDQLKGVFGSGQD